MPDHDLSRLLERAAAQPRTSQDDIQRVWRRGRSRRRRREAVVAVGSVLAAAAVIVLAASIWPEPTVPVIDQPQEPASTTPSPPPSTLSVPDVVGLTLAEAQRQLEALGLVGKASSGADFQDPTSPEAVVAQQEPPPGAPVPPGAVVGFRTAVVTAELCDVLTQLPPRTSDAQELAATDGYWDMLERASEVAPQSIAQDVRALLDFRETGQPITEAPTRALDTVTTHHDACHASR